MRRCLPGDESGLKNLWAKCFDDTPRYIEYFFHNRFDPDLAMCVEVENRIVCGMHIVPYSVDLRGQQVKTAYLVGVATLPEYRMRGLSKELIREGLRLLREMGYRFSHLYPFYHGFYRKMGYGVADRMTMAMVPSGDAEEIMPRAAVRPLQVEDAPEVLNCYLRQMQGKTGFVIRTRENTEDRLREYLLEGKGYLSNNINGVTGYVLCYTDGVDIKAEELCCQDDAALLSLVRAMAGDSVGKVHFPVLDVPADGCAWRIQREDGAMGRIIDLDGLTINAPKSASDLLVLNIVDDFLPEQSGTYRICAQNGSVSFRRCGACHVNGEASIEEISEMVLGSYLWKENENNGWKGIMKSMVPPADTVLFEKY